MICNAFSCDPSVATRHELKIAALMHKHIGVHSCATEQWQPSFVHQPEPIWGDICNLIRKDVRSNREISNHLDMPIDEIQRITTRMERAGVIRRLSGGKNIPIRWGMRR
jgi:hypothetical protein